MAEKSSPEMTSAEYTGWQLELFTAFFVPLQVIAVALRIYSRRFVETRWGLDDGIVLVSLVLQLVLAGVSVSAVKDGTVGYHVAYLEETNPEKLELWGKYLVAISSLYFFIVNIPKLAILALYHRLFPAKWTRRTVYVLAAILIGNSIANTTAALAACSPFEANYSPVVSEGECIDKEALFIWSSIPNIVTDLVMLVLPLPVVWKLHTNKRMKIGLTFTFLVGSFGLVTSILRFHTFFNNNSFTDGTFAAVELIIWTETEPGIYLISACLPTYRPLLDRWGVKRITEKLATIKTTATGNNTQNVSRPQHVISPPILNAGSSIPLSSRLNCQGFRELDDKSMGSDESIPGVDNSQIKVTTDIYSDWNKV